MPARVKDGHLTLVSTDPHDGRRFWYLGAQHIDAVDPSLPRIDRPFVLLIVSDATHLDDDELKRFARSFIRRGCLAIGSWGPECVRVETAFDIVATDPEEDEREYPHDVLLTTAHDDEPLADAFWFFHMCTQPLDADRLAIVIGDRDDWKDDVWAFLADPSSSYIDDEST